MTKFKLVPAVGQIWQSYATGYFFTIDAIKDGYVEMTETTKGVPYIGPASDVFPDSYILTKLAPSRVGA